MRARFLIPLALALPLLAEQPPIHAHNVTVVAASADLGRQLAALPSGTWAGWAIPAPRQIYCRWHDEGVSFSDDVGVPSDVAFFVHVMDRRVDRVHIASRDCAFDEFGANVTWIEHVDPRASNEELISLARNNELSSVRSKALFWLAIVAGDKAAGTLRDAVDNDPETRVKERAVMGISMLPDDQSIPLLADLMRTHKNGGVRKKAAFWLGQKKDPRALEVIEEFLKR